MHPIGLSRQTTGLTEAHRDLIELLAEIAVTNYLREVEPDDAQNDGTQHEDRA